MRTLGVHSIRKFKVYAQVLSHFSPAKLFATLWSTAFQAPLSMGFSRPENWSGLLCPPLRNFPDPVSCVGRHVLYHYCQLGRPQSTSLQFSHSVMSNALRLHELQHTGLPCPTSTPRASSDSCPLHWGYHPTVSPSVVPFSSCLQSFPSLGTFQMNQFFTSDVQSIGISASTSVPRMYAQDWFPLGLTGLISLTSKGLSRVFSNTIVQNHQFFRAQLSL